MKILRSVTRRSDNLGTAGFFSGVLRPTTWFAASRLPTGSRFYEHQSTWTTTLAPGQNAQNPATGRETTPQITIPATSEPRPLRKALIAIAAIAITFTLLWWICLPR